MSHLALPEPSGEEDKETSPRENMRTVRKMCQEGDRDHPMVINRPAFGPSANTTVPDTQLDCVPAWNKVALSLLLFVSVPKTLLTTAWRQPAARGQKRARGN